MRNGGRRSKLLTGVTIYISLKNVDAWMLRNSSRLVDTPEEGPQTS